MRVKKKTYFSWVGCCLWLLGVFLMVGCSRLGPLYQPASLENSEDKAILYIYRPQVGLKTLKPPLIYIRNGEIRELTNLEKNSYQWVSLEPGRYTLWSEAMWGIPRSVVTIEVESGKSYYLKYQALPRHKSLFSVPEQKEAIEEIQSCRLYS